MTHPMLHVVPPKTFRERVSALLLPAPVILMYHAVGGPGEQAGRYVVPARRFARQMAWLKLARYRVLDLEALLEYRRTDRVPPARSVVITFDDGYADNRTLALPILRRFGFRATFFVVTGRIGGTNTWDAVGELAGRPLLTWADVREMAGDGMRIGAHTRSHPVLPELPAEEVRREVEGSRLDLERELGAPVQAFAYPYGRLDDTAQDAVARAGFAAACCSRSGTNTPDVSSYLLRRVEVRGTDSLLRFARKVWRGRAPRRSTRAS